MRAFPDIFQHKGVRITTHIIFWGLVLLFYTLFFGHQQGNYVLTFNFVILLMPITIGTTYIFNYFLIPRFLMKSRIREFILFSFYALVVSFWITSLIFLPTLSLIGPGQNAFDKSLIDLYFVIVGLYSASLLAISIKLLKLGYEQRHRSVQFLKEKTEAELAMLKGQINPHFLFNTLNNIYALALKKSDLTAEAVVKLSNMLDYLLYECKMESVPLKKEVELIRNYIYLQKIRFGNRLNIQFETDHIGEELLPPNMFLPFLENSFKHGAGKQSRDVWIKIQIRCENRMVHFHIRNSKGKEKDDTQQRQTGGIGLENVKKRLELLYQNNYSLDIENLSDTFNVRLQIPIIKQG